MFWIAIFGFFLVWMLTKFGVLSATVGILAMVIKMLLIVLLIGAVAAGWFWLRKKNPGATAKQ